MKESREIANDATRERFIDEYVTSAIWLGGIPATEAVMDKFITKKGYNPNVNLKQIKHAAKNFRELNIISKNSVQWHKKMYKKLWQIY